MRYATTATQPPSIHVDAVGKGSNRPLEGAGERKRRVWQGMDRTDFGAIVVFLTALTG